jgi:ADP-ribosylglycohydrolase
MAENLTDAILGCIVGGAIGDAAGSQFEGSDQQPALPELLAADWRLTDDTQMTLATCEAIVDRGSPEPAAIAASFVRWFRERRITCMGASTFKALEELNAGAHWALTGRKGERAAGNGAAMRIAPLAFCVNPSNEDSRRLIRDVCRITHHSDEAYAGALAILVAIRAAQAGNLSLESIASGLPDTSVRDRMLEYAAVSAEITLGAVAGRFGNSGYVVESVPFAIFATSRLLQLGFTELLVQVIGAGGDTDTNGSLAGQIAGIAIGFKRIPKDLIARLPDADSVLNTVSAFARVVAHGR